MGDTSSDVNREETASLQRVTTTITIIRTETGGGVTMASDAEIRMMMMLNSMDLEREAGPMSSEDRLFMGSHQGARTQQQSQINPFGGVRWEGGRPVYNPSTYQPQPQDSLLFPPQQQQKQQEELLQQQLQMHQHQQMLIQQQQLAQMQQQQSQQPQQQVAEERME